MYIGRQPQKEGAYRKVDAFGFNGTLTTFDLEISGRAIIPGTAENLMVVVDDIPLEPGVDYTVSGSTITFDVAHTTGLSHHCVYLGDSYKAPETRPVELSDITNVNAASPSVDDILKWNGSSWVNDGTIGTTHIEALAGLVVGVKTVNDVIRWNGMSWVNAQLYNPALNELSNVSSASPSTDNILQFTGAQWEPVAPDTIPATLDDLTDVAYPIAPATDDILVWNGAAWEPTAPAGGTPHALTSHTDYDGTPTDGQALVWDEATSNWIPGTIESGGSVTVEEILTLYVDETGSDVTGDGSSGAPFATVSKALTEAKNYVVNQKIVININAGDASGEGTSGGIIEDGPLTINFPVPVHLISSVSAGLNFSGALSGDGFISPLTSNSSMFWVHSKLVIDGINIRNSDGPYSIFYTFDLFDAAKVHLKNASVNNVAAFTKMITNTNHCEEFIVGINCSASFSSPTSTRYSHFENVGKLELGKLVEGDTLYNNRLTVNTSGMSASPLIKIVDCLDATLSIEIGTNVFDALTQSFIESYNSIFKKFHFTDLTEAGSTHIQNPYNLIMFYKCIIEEIEGVFGDYQNTQFMRFENTIVKGGSIRFTCTGPSTSGQDCPFYIYMGSDVHLDEFSHIDVSYNGMYPPIKISTYSRLSFALTENFVSSEEIVDMSLSNEISGLVLGNTGSFVIHEGGGGGGE